MYFNKDIFNNLKQNGNDLSNCLIYNKIKFCSKCNGKLRYVNSGTYVCEKCGNEEIDDFGKIKQYLDLNGPSSAHIISIATGVDKQIIELFLQKGRIEITDDSLVFLKCEICKEDIKSGKICPNCAKETVSRLKGYYIDDVGDIPKRTEKMRFLNRNKE